MKVNTALMTIASVNAQYSNSLDICEATYQGINERVLACPGGRINIISAEYGRPNDDRDTCCANARKCWVKPGTECTVDAFTYVNEKCQDRSECTLFGNMNGISGDPCPKRHKFLNVQYGCDYSQPSVKTSFCEAELDNRTDSISCQNEGEVITVREATWGRERDAYCCPNRQEDKCMASDCSRSTDATELMGLRCDGQASCTWNSSIAEEIRDPCTDVFKYMTVDYECAVPTTPAPIMAASYGNNCLDVMMAAFNYYSALQIATEGDKTHHKQFIASYKDENDLYTVNTRMNLFKNNMRKWGNKLANNGCNCDQQIADDINSATNAIQSNENPIADYEAVNDLLDTMADNFACDSKSSKMINGVKRKVTHAVQILTGFSDKNKSTIKNRHQNWKTFVQSL